MIKALWCVPFSRLPSICRLINQQQCSGVNHQWQAIHALNKRLLRPSSHSGGAVVYSSGLCLSYNLQIHTVKQFFRTQSTYGGRISFIKDYNLVHPILEITRNAYRHFRIAVSSLINIEKPPRKRTFVKKKVYSFYWQIVRQTQLRARALVKCIVPPC